MGPFAFDTFSDLTINDFFYNSEDMLTFDRILCLWRLSRTYATDASYKQFDY